MATDPVFQGKNYPNLFLQSEKWYFWDETWADHYGPFESEKAAQAACLNYANTYLA